MTIDETKWTDANRRHLASGRQVLSCDYMHESNEDTVILDGIKCKFIDRHLHGYPWFMRYDKYLEKLEELEIEKWLDEWGYVPFEIM